VLKIKIKKWFFEAVALSNCDSELKHTLRKGHPRLEKFIDNLAEQFKKADEILVKRGIYIKQRTMQDTTYDMTKVFITAIELEAKKRYESDLDKAARAVEASKTADIENFLSGGTDNEYSQELGLINEDAKIKTV
jgi:hypothetical protein